jgi:hypothetical protein
MVSVRESTPEPTLKKSVESIPALNDERQSKSM